MALTEDLYNLILHYYQLLIIFTIQNILKMMVWMYIHLKDLFKNQLDKDDFIKNQENNIRYHKEHATLKLFNIDSWTGSSSLNIIQNLNFSNKTITDEDQSYDINSGSLILNGGRYKKILL